MDSKFLVINTINYIGDTGSKVPSTVKKSIHLVSKEELQEMLDNSGLDTLGRTEVYEIKRKLNVVEYTVRSGSNRRIIRAVRDSELEENIVEVDEGCILYESKLDAVPEFSNLFNPECRENETEPG
jgi:hypothetical protein